MIGILQSQFSDDYKYDLESRLSPLGITNLDNIPNHFQYTNFACVLDPIYQVIDEKCEATDSLSITSCKRSELTSALDNEAKQAFEAWRTTLPKIFKYRFVFSPKKMHYTADPVCVLTNEQDKKAYDSYVTKSGTYGFRSEVISVVLQEILTLSSQLKIDDFYRIKRWDLETKFLNPLSIDLKSSGDYWIGTSALQKTISGNTTFDLLFADKSPLQLKKCSESEYLSQEKTLIFYEGQLIPEDQYQSENKKPEMNPELCR